MITNNLISAMTMIFSSTTNFLFKKYNGESQGWGNRNLPGLFSSDLTAKSYSEIANDGMSLLLGSGTTTATKTDYKLESIESKYTVLLQNHTIFEGKYSDQILLVNRFIQNTSDENITISEIGLFGYQMMFAREVLSEAVILKPGEKHTFSLSISLG